MFFINSFQGKISQCEFNSRVCAVIHVSCHPVQIYACYKAFLTIVICFFFNDRCKNVSGGGSKPEGIGLPSSLLVPHFFVLREKLFEYSRRRCSPQVSISVRKN